MVEVWVFHIRQYLTKEVELGLIQPGRDVIRLTVAIQFQIFALHNTVDCKIVFSVQNLI